MGIPSGRLEFALNTLQRNSRKFFQYGFQLRTPHPLSANELDHLAGSPNAPAL